MIDLRQYAPQEFNVDFNTPVGNLLKMTFEVKINHLVYIAFMQIVNNDSVAHDYDGQYQGNGTPGLATFITLNVASGSSRVVIPADTQAPIEPLIDGPLLLVGPCTFILQDTTAQASLVATGFKMNWLEGISTIDIAARSLPQVTQDP